MFRVLLSLILRLDAMSNTANLTKSSFDESRFLPQFGFDSDVTFESISRYHRYLFRIYTPKSLPAVEDDSIFFVGARFNNTFAPQTPVMSEMYSSSCAPLIETATYEDCVQHLSWETRSSSPFISATFNFAWALWDAVRRFRGGMKHDVEIAVIDAAALSGKAVTTMQLLRRSPSSEKRRHPRHRKWCRFAQESQSVLIHGSIPRSAVLASVPLRIIVQNLPSYFLQTPSSSRNIRPPIDPPFERILAWDPIGQKNASFRRFCQEMGDRFKRMPYHTRVREIAIGSVRLAITLLDPWFHRTVMHGDIHSAVTRIRELSALIAHWPEQPGSRDYSEMASLMKALILLLAEEVQDSSSRTRQIATEEVLHLQRIVDDLLDVVRGHKVGTISPGFAKSRSNECQKISDLSVIDSESESGLNVAQLTWDSEAENRSLSKLRIIIPHSTASETSSSSPCSSPSSAAPLTPKSDASFTSPSSLKMGPFPHPHPEPPSPSFSASSPLIPPQSEVSLSSLPSPLTISIPLIESPQFEYPVQNADLSNEYCSENFTLDPLPAEYPDDDDDDSDDLGTDSDGSSSIAFHEVVSYALTGFLVGTVITLCILSSQRRTMLYVT
ncbi:MAG: hypothetical protein NXY57DRAFT_175393 [Lentinula lateritia]|nr:MAG: hypothetical protein NXY57DRAFT_175393 [Lentinula lateritia]